MNDSKKPVRKSHLAPYDKAAKWARTLGISSSNWYAKVREIGAAWPKHVPKRPDIAYRDMWQEKGGWQDFLRPPNFTYEEASAWGKKHGIRTGVAWKAKHKEMGDKWPLRLPVLPYNRYRAEWKKNGGWGGFLGTGKKPRGFYFMSYDEARQWAITNGITSSYDWRERRKKEPGLFPDNLPGAPYLTYKEEFENGGWQRFLGKTEGSS